MTLNKFSLVLALFLLSSASIKLCAAEMVIVTTADGKKQVGELAAADADKIVVRDGDGKDTQILWKDVQKVSNGLTREKALAKWKVDNSDKLCKVCHGDRVMACAKCNGTGTDSKVKIACVACTGTGSVKCTQKGCVNGKSDCTGNCLKLSEGEWVPGDGGKRWRKFTNPDGRGWATWSDAHLGQVVEVENGKYVNKGVCQLCKGTTKIDCPLCQTKGFITCPTCKGTKEAFAPCAACKGAKTTGCTECGGTGLSKK